MNVLANAPVLLPMAVDEPMARTSDIALVVTMSILALSMLAYTGYLAAADGRRFGTAGQFLAWAGTAALIVTIATRGLSVSRAPLGNMYEYISMICVLAVISAAIVIQRREWRSVWPSRTITAEHPMGWNHALWKSTVTESARSIPASRSRRVGETSSAPP